MLRRLCFRLFLCCLALAGILTALLCFAGYLATREPAFYAELKSQEFSQVDQKLAEANLRLLEKNFERWSARSIALQQAQKRNPNLAPQEFLQGEYDPASDVHVVRITDQHLNAMLASADSHGEWQRPRIMISDGRIDFACEIVTPELSCIVSAGLQPTVTDEGQLQLDILSTHVGRLPLPLETLWSWVREMDVSEGDVEIDRLSPKPRLRWNLMPQDLASPTVRSIECREGQLVIEFCAPVLKREQPKGDEAQIAANSLE